MTAAASSTDTQDARQDYVQAARQAGLRHVHDRQPGISRRGRHPRFHYLGGDGMRIGDELTLNRIRMLAIPPAWTEVWICTAANGHIQATGRDAKGRKQYRYHNKFRQVRDETKYDKIFDFVAALPAIRARCEQDLQRQGLPREKVLAAVVKLLEETLIRVGNEEYSRVNNSFGLTTLRNRHAKIRGADVQFRFRGKSGKDHTVSLHDKRLAKIVKHCRDLPGDELFQYLDADGAQHAIDSSDVNGYLRTVTNSDFTAKDFRTWAGTLYTATVLAELGVQASERAAKKQIKEAIQHASERLGNTPTICRKCYVHPAILDAYTAGRVVPRVAHSNKMQRAKAALHADEKAVIGFLKRQLEQAKKLTKTGSLSQLLVTSVTKARDAKSKVRSAVRQSASRACTVREAR